MSDSPVLRAAALVVAATLVLAAIAALLAAVLLALAVWFCHRHPYVAAAMALSLSVALIAGVPAAAALWVLALACVLVLRSHRRTVFDRRVLRHWRRTFVYRWRWRRAMRTCDLARPGALGVHEVARLGTVRSSRWVDSVSLHPLDGQDVAAFAARTHELTRAFGALSCRVHGDPTGVVRLELRRGDPLRSQAPLPGIPTRTDLTALPLGRREDGAPSPRRRSAAHGRPARAAAPDPRRDKARTG